eukprot:PLAT15797.1.p2 GENE.PLAT15797.1~~PLAT15797.1.p2  ORF type:complete len:243 (+),score=119.22 PLAT15797.1:11-739(+)
MAVEKPLLVELPMRIETERLVLLPPRRELAAAYHETWVESLPQYHATFLPKSVPCPTLEETTEKVIRQQMQWLKREHLHYYIFLKLEDGSGGEEGADLTNLLGGISCMRSQWVAPHFELGYFLRTSETGKGYMTEAAAAMEELAHSLGGRRITLHIDSLNGKSQGVARRLGFKLEHVIRHCDRRPADGALMDLMIFAKLYDDDGNARDFFDYSEVWEADVAARAAAKEAAAAAAAAAAGDEE